MSKVSQAQLRATKKWEDANYYKTLIRFPKDAESLIRAKGEQVGSVNGYISSLVLADLGYKKDVN